MVNVKKYSFGLYRSRLHTVPQQRGIVASINSDHLRILMIMSTRRFCKLSTK